AISRERPSLVRLGQAVAITLVVALPWYVYQLLVHPHWIWAEFVLTEMWGYGAGSPPQTTQETQLAFYLRRMVVLDLPLAGVALAALIRHRPRLLLAWLMVVLACAVGFRYRNAAYLLPMIPAMVLLAAGAIPKYWAAWALGLSVALFAGKAL